LIEIGTPENTRHALLLIELGALAFGVAIEIAVA